jgi:hypothetical protein
VKVFIAALAAWTIVCGAILLFYPAGGELLGCMHKVGRGPDCEAAQEALNQAYQLRHTLPLVTLMLSGYLLVAAAALVRRRRQERLVGEVGVEG